MSAGPRRGSLPSGPGAAPAGAGAAPPGPSAPPLTLCTAGHIDHGKTALITTLTGKNTDRLREERERGISIELGYAELTLPSGRRLSVVDVPGHERFVRTMVAGATGVDLFLLVVAADDGVMPQSREHVAILDLLGVRDGVVAITKADLVDDELLTLVSSDVREFLAGTPFRRAPVVAVSARDGRGVPALLSALDAAAAAAARARGTGPARLPVDRSFALKGIGAIVTGTLWRGEVRPGDELLVQPGGRRVSVRSIQVHDHATDVALAGQRVGLSLRAVDKVAIERGQWLLAPSPGGAVTRSFDAWVSLLPGTRPLRTGEHVRLHHGTAQAQARLILLGAEQRELAGGAQAAAVVRLDGERAVEAHDRFILRSLSPVATIGGGVILDVQPRHWRDRAEHERFAAALLDGDLAAAALALAATRGVAGMSAGDLSTAGVAAAALAPVLTTLEVDGHLQSLEAGEPRPAQSGAGRGPGTTAGRPAKMPDGERRWFAAQTVEGLRGEVLGAAMRRARERPERPFMPAAELAALAPGLPAVFVAALLARLVEDGTLVAGEGGYALAGVRAALTPEQESQTAALLARLRAAPLAPPALAALAAELNQPRAELERLLEVLARRGDLVRAEKDIWFTTEAVAVARRLLENYLADHGEITLATFRDLSATGRRVAQLLLELFDRQGVTRRRGDVRVARTRRVSPPSGPATPGRPST